MRPLKAETGGHVKVQEPSSPAAPSLIPSLSRLYHDSHQSRGSIMTLSNTIYSVFSFTGFLFCAILLPWHLKRKVEPLLRFLHFSMIEMDSMLADRNTGTCLFMAWSGISCLCQFISSVIWNGNIVDWSPVWCDIGTVDFNLIFYCGLYYSMDPRPTVTKTHVGSSVGIPASSLCIFRHLYKISMAPGTIPTADKFARRHRVMVDLALGLGLPCLVMVLGMVYFHYKRELLLISRIDYVAQGHRYNILEDIGCSPTVYVTPVHIIFVSIPPVLTGLVTACYAVPTIIAFNRRRVEFNDHLLQHSNLSSSFYLRLMCFGGLEILATVPLATFFLYSSIASGINPWTGWRDVHAHFSNVRFLPRSVWSEYPDHELSRWIRVICAFIFFAFFGFAEEARTNYHAAYLTVAKTIGLYTASSKPSGSLRTKSKRNDIETLVFAHTTTTNISTPIPDGENHNANKKEDQTPQVNTTSANTSFNTDVNNCHLYPVPPTLPEPAVIKS